MSNANFFPLPRLLQAADIVTILFFFFNDTATTEIYTLSLHDALPIFPALYAARSGDEIIAEVGVERIREKSMRQTRSEEHTSELQSQSNLVCRLLLEKKEQGPASERRGCVRRRLPQSGFRLRDASRHG